MGEIERRAKRNRLRNNVQGAILAAVAAVPAITVAAVIPGITVALGRIAGKKLYRARTAAGRLAQKGLVEFIDRDGKKYMRITDKGRRVIALSEARGGSAIRKPWRWDRRYRIVMFDIPEARKNVRNRARLLVKEFGFLRLQDSVWIIPYDCEEIITLLKAELRIGKDLLYVIADEVENDGWIKKHFRLK